MKSGIRIRNVNYLVRYSRLNDLLWDEKTLSKKQTPEKESGNKSREETPAKY